MPSRTGFGFLFLTLLVACSSDPTTGEGSSTSGGGGACPEGFTAIENGGGCTPIIAPNECKDGTRAAIGEETCTSVGVTSCAAGFARDGSGYGCNAVLPAAECTGANRERLGKSACEPINDCNAAFPPPEATHFVDPNGVEDAKHFRTIEAAVKAVPEGAVIAIEAGTYPEKIVLTKSHLRFVGRCAEKVIMRLPDGADGSGFEVGTQTAIALERFSMKGFNAAVSVLGGKASLEGMLIEDGTTAAVVSANDGADVKAKNVVVRNIRVKKGAQQAFGLFASTGGKLTVEDSVVNGGEFGNVGLAKQGTSVSIARSIIRNGKSFGTQFGMGIYATEGATLNVEESAILDNVADGINVFGVAKPVTTATIKRSLIRGTKLEAQNKIGRGIEASFGKLVIEGSTIVENAQLQVLVSEKTDAQITDSSIIGATAADPKDFGALGLVVQDGKAKASSLAIVSSRAGAELLGASSLEMDRSLIKSTRLATNTYSNNHWIGLGIAVESKADLTLTNSSLEDTHTIGIAVLGRATVEGTIVRGTRASLDGFAGRAMSIQNGGTADVSRSAFVDNAESGIIVMLGGAALTMRDSTIKNTLVDHDGAFGIGLLLGGGATGTVETSTITGSKGIGVAVAAAQASVKRTVISDNTVGVHAQEGSSIVEGDGETAANVLLISPDTRFVGNATRAGNGVVVLPQLLETKPN